MDVLSNIPWSDEDVTLDHATVGAIMDLGCTGGGCKWAESYAKRWEELGSWNLEGVDQPLITKTTTVFIPYKMNNEQWREEQLKDLDISLIVKVIQSKDLFYL